MSRSSGCLFPSIFRVKLLHELVISPMRPTCTAYVILLDLIHPNNVRWSAQVV
jgi:hypothetical protein